MAAMVVIQHPGTRSIREVPAVSWGRAEVGSAEKPRAAVHRVLTAGATLDTAPFEPLLTPDLVGSEIARLYQTPDMWDERRVYQLESNGLHAPA